tara:strand:- start:1275 stop:1631 length:357 start_codon:yes stop_codon:yes gene_type:complete
MVDKLNGLTGIHHILGAIAKESEPVRRKKSAALNNTRTPKSSLSLQEYMSIEAQKRHAVNSLSGEWLLEVILRWQFGEQMMNESKSREMLQSIVKSIDGTALEAELEAMVKQLNAVSH